MRTEKVIVLRVHALGHHLMMDLNDNEAINWQSQDVEPGRIITDFSAMASGFHDSFTDRT